MAESAENDSQMLPLGQILPELLVLTPSRPSRTTATRRQKAAD
jgi:hypothetical protein